jgi:hypothetical protein
MTWLHVAGIAAVVAFVIYANRCAYYNGATDGYGYSKEPTNPGYQKAGMYLRRFMAHRWAELKLKHGPQCPCPDCYHQRVQHTL